MTAKEILSPGKTVADRMPGRIVEADMPLLELLPRLLDAPGREVGVSDGETTLGVVDQTSMLEGLARMIAARDDSDPSAAVRSLERYDFKVLEAHGSSDGVRDAAIATERLMALQALLNV